MKVILEKPAFHFTFCFYLLPASLRFEIPVFLHHLCAAISPFTFTKRFRHFSLQIVTPFYKHGTSVLWSVENGNLQRCFQNPDILKYKIEFKISFTSSIKKTFHFLSLLTFKHFSWHTSAVIECGTNMAAAGSYFRRRRLRPLVDQRASE